MVYDVFGKRKITGIYGEKRPYYKNGHTHQGYDIAYYANEPLLSAIDGTVVNIGNDANGYGNYIDIENNGVKTRYAHANNFNVKKGDKVKAGQRIGLAGSTGRSTGPHLHLEVYNNGVLTDPKELNKIMATNNTNAVAQAYAQQMAGNKLSPDTYKATERIEIDPQIKQATIENLLSQLKPIEKPHVTTIEDIINEKNDKLGVFADYLKTPEAIGLIDSFIWGGQQDDKGNFYADRRAMIEQAKIDKAEKEYLDAVKLQSQTANALYGNALDVDKANIQNAYNYDKLNSDNQFNYDRLNTDTKFNYDKLNSDNSYRKDMLDWEKSEENPRNKPEKPSFSNITTVRKEFNSIPAVKNYAEIKRQRNNVNAVRKQLEGKGTLKYNANDQTLITTFNKILDPTSVVRESEFARTAAGQSLIDQIQGAATKMTKGGSGLSKEERESVFNAIEAMYKAQEEEARRYAGEYKALAEKYGISASDIIGTQWDALSQDDAQPQDDALEAEMKRRRLKK